jgi:hypothetical protein
MSDQLLGRLPGGLPRYVRLVARRKIIGPEWEFGVGKKLMGVRESDGRWRVWPHGHEHAWLSGVPGWYVRRDRAPGRKIKS